MLVDGIGHTIRAAPHCRKEDHEERCRVLASVQQIADRLRAAVSKPAQALSKAEPGGQAPRDRHKHVLVEAEDDVRVPQPAYRIEAHNVVVIGHAGDQRVHLVAHPEVGEPHVVQRGRHHTTHQPHRPPARGPVHDGQRIDQQRDHDQRQRQREDERVLHIDQIVEEEPQYRQRPQQAKGAGDLQECRRLQMAARVNLKD